MEKKQQPQNISQTFGKLYLLQIFIKTDLGVLSSLYYSHQVSMTQNQERSSSTLKLQNHLKEM